MDAEGEFSQNQRRWVNKASNSAPCSSKLAENSTPICILTASFFQLRKQLINGELILSRVCSKLIYNGFLFKFPSFLSCKRKQVGRAHSISVHSHWLKHIRTNIFWLLRGRCPSFLTLIISWRGILILYEKQILLDSLSNWNFVFNLKYPVKIIASCKVLINLTLLDLKWQTDNG